MYSSEFLNSILKTYYNREDLNLKVNTILNIFGIAKSTLYEWIKNKPLIINGKRTFNKKYPLHEYDRLVVNHVIKNKIIDHQKIIDKVKNKYNKTISRNIIYKILKRNNITRKRVQTKKCNYRLQSKYDLQLKHLRKSIKTRKKRIISLDETSIDFIVPCNYGWSKKGTKCTRYISHERYRVSLLIAISMNKIINYHIKEGTFNMYDFNNFMDEIHIDNGYYRYLMDNAKIHHNKMMDDRIRDKIVYNVPYCPEYNPIEYFFNTLKQKVKKLNINNISKLQDLLDKNMSKLRFDKYFEKSYSNLKI